VEARRSVDVTRSAGQSRRFGNHGSDCLGTHDARCAITGPCHLRIIAAALSSAMILRHDASIRCVHLSNGRGALSHQQSRPSFRKSTWGKRCWPHLRVHCLSRGGPGSHCCYPADRVPSGTCFRPRQKASYASTHCHVPPQYWNPPTCLGRAPALPCVKGSRPLPSKLEGLWCCHVPRGSEPPSASRRGLELQRVPQHWTPPHH
jgi:hypothetical protein